MAGRRLSTSRLFHRALEVHPRKGLVAAGVGSCDLPPRTGTRCCAATASSDLVIARITPRNCADSDALQPVYGRAFASRSAASRPSSCTVAGNDLGACPLVVGVDIVGVIGDLLPDPDAAPLLPVGQVPHMLDRPAVAERHVRCQKPRITHPLSLPNPGHPRSLEEPDPSSPPSHQGGRRNGARTGRASSSRTGARVQLGRP